jgi:ADP-ribosylglycohydrolase
MDNDKAKGLMFGLAIGDALVSVACIAGGISGAYLGIAAIPA